MFKKFFAALAVMFFIFSATSTKTFAGEVIKVTGAGIGPIGAKSGGSFYRSFARQVAKLDAMRNLVEMIGGVTVSSLEKRDPTGKIISDTTTAETTCNEKFWNKYFSKVEVVGVKFKSDGSCEVTMQGILK